MVPPIAYKEQHLFAEPQARPGDSEKLTFKDATE